MDEKHKQLQRICDALYELRKALHAGGFPEFEILMPNKDLERLDSSLKEAQGTRQVIYVEAVKIGTPFYNSKHESGKLRDD